MMFIVEHYSDKDHAIVRKHFDHKLHGGPKLSASESQRFRRINKREDKQFLIDVGTFVLLFGPALWFLMSIKP